MKIMSKKIHLTLAAASAMMAIPFLGLTSCDSGPVNTGGASSFELGTRFDADELVANAADTVVMPPFLLEGDSFTHSVNFTSFPLVANPTGEYGQGFLDGDAPIVVNSSGQISNSEGDSLANNVSYIYDPDTTSFSLSEQNAFGGLTGEALRDNFENRLDVIRNLDFAQGGSVADFMNTNSTTAEAQIAYEAAMESIGLVASDTGLFFPLNFFLFQLPGTTYTGNTVRLNRVINYAPQSSNATLLATGQITGTVTITDTYANVQILAAHDNRGPVLALEPSNFITVNGFIVEYNGLQTIVETYTGPFTLDLATDAF